MALVNSAVVMLVMMMVMLAKMMVLVSIMWMMMVRKVTMMVRMVRMTSRVTLPQAGPSLAWPSPASWALASVTASASAGGTR